MKTQHFNVDYWTKLLQFYINTLFLWKQTCRVLQSTWFRKTHNSSFLYHITLVLYKLCCKEFTLPHVYMAQVSLNARWSFAQQASCVWFHDDLFLRNIALPASVIFWSVPWGAASESEASHSLPSSWRTQSLQLERARWAGGRPRAKRWRNREGLNRVFQAHLRWFDAKYLLRTKFTWKLTSHDAVYHASSL